jgi:hypothetical protein
VTRTLEDQIRSLADRSVGAVDPSEGLVPEGAHVPELVDAAGSAAPHRPRTWLVAAVALVVVIGALAAVALWRDPEPQPVTTAPFEDQAWALCPDSVPRRAVEGGVPSDGDALPELSNAVTEPAAAEATLERDSASLKQRYPAAFDLRVGPGFGWAWTGVNGGDYSIVQVESFGIEVRLADPASCPIGSELYVYSGTFPSAPLFFLYPVEPSTGPSSTVVPPAPTAGWQLGPDGAGRADASFVAGVTRSECSGGSSFDVGPPIVEMGASEVVVTFRPPELPPANRTCLGNVPSIVEVHLPEPLGDRVLVDGGCLEDGRLPPNLCERWRP